MMRTKTNYMVPALVILLAGCSGTLPDDEQNTVVSVVPNQLNATSDVVNATDESTQTQQNPIEDGEGYEDFMLPRFQINEDNYRALLNQAFEVYFGTAYDQRLPTNHMQRLVSGAAIDHREEVDGFATTHFTTFACSNGGTVEQRLVAGISPVISYGFEADNCQYRGDLVSGQFDLGGFRDTSHYDIALQNFKVDFGVSDGLSAHGMYRRFTTFTGGYGGNPSDWTEHWRTKSLDYTISYLGSDLAIENASTLGWYGYVRREKSSNGDFWLYRAHMEGEFTMQGTFSSGATIDVMVVEPFTQEYRVNVSADYRHGAPYSTPPTPHFSSGNLLLIADDGTTAQLRPSSHVANHVDVTLTNYLGSDNQQTFTLPWSVFSSAMRLRDKTLEFPMR